MEDWGREENWPGEEESRRGCYDSVFERGLSGNGDQRVKVSELDWSCFGKNMILKSNLNDLVRSSSSQLNDGHKLNKIELYKMENVDRALNVSSSSCITNTRKNQISEGSEASLQTRTLCEIKNTSFSRSSKRIVSTAKPSYLNTVKETSRRKDLVAKHALRQFRKFYKEAFRTKNQDTVPRRYTKICQTKIHQHMYLTLEDIIEEEHLTDELIYYTIGVTRIKKAHQLSCCFRLKQEMKDFIDLTFKFSHNRLHKCLQSESFKILLKYYLNNSDNNDLRDLCITVTNA
ncbi:unnamed protein product [Moneuplotes crassus]|uniref:Uncharacterized protein n=1 Tax=Euplotes crassus TaxID=5936 RepID=A0AAD1XQ00_EUPCR|nr:unnamed protein product [Moneuplotes crassus]